MAAQRDPVCGMEVDERTASSKSNFQGQDYYFCSQGCKSKFDQNPQQYAGQASGAQRGGQNR
ncbi:MAG TPA: YHS domain-containing protein [Blastocatellia bacterium]|nr:YHS domain-containing protein [Blastocatellia bacterium]